MGLRLGHDETLNGIILDGVLLEGVELAGIAEGPKLK